MSFWLNGETAYVAAVSPPRPQVALLSWRVRWGGVWTTCVVTIHNAWHVISVHYYWQMEHSILAGRKTTKHFILRCQNHPPHGQPPPKWQERKDLGISRWRGKKDEEMMARKRRERVYWCVLRDYGLRLPSPLSPLHRAKAEIHACQWTVGRIIQ